MSERFRYATLADRMYAIKLALMIESLTKLHAADVWVLALDDETRMVAEWIDERIEWGGCVHVRTLAALEAELPSVADARRRLAWPHFCWMMGSVWTATVMSRHRDHVAYLDADLWFAGDPQAMWGEMGSASVVVVPHRFPPRYAHYAVNGRFNVSAVLFEGDIGRATLGAWAGQCLGRCDAETVGDQKYLDAWPNLLGRNLHEFRSKGIGAAPWNAWSYVVGRRLGKPEQVMVDDDDLIFYHFHEFARDRAQASGFRRSRGYPMTPELSALVYEPYERAYVEMEKRIAAAGIDLKLEAKA